MKRLHSLQEGLCQSGLDALWVSGPTNVRALSGFSSPYDGKILVTTDSATLYTDARYTVQAKEECQMDIHIARPPETFEHAARIVAGLKVGIEGDYLTVSQLEELENHWPDATLISTTDLIETLRIVKTPQEIQQIQAASDIADQVFNDVRPMIQAGVRELDIANELETRLRQAGARHSFDIIVASGPRGAMPHGLASERVIQDNELVTIDMGATKNGYNSDMTRTVAVGSPSQQLRDMYNAVLDAEEAAVKAVKPGIRTADLDQLARDVLSKHNLAEYFAHTLGHGIGLAVHEGPRFRSESSDVLEPGMVVTIEPGVYIEDVGGVRIEDMVLVTTDGYKVINGCPKEQL